MSLSPRGPVLEPGGSWRDPAGMLSTASAGPEAEGRARGGEIPSAERGWAGAAPAPAPTLHPGAQGRGAGGLAPLGDTDPDGQEDSAQRGETGGRSTPHRHQERRTVPPSWATASGAWSLLRAPRTPEPPEPPEPPAPATHAQSRPRRPAAEVSSSRPVSALRVRAVTSAHRLHRRGPRLHVAPASAHAGPAGTAAAGEPQSGWPCCPAVGPTAPLTHASSHGGGGANLWRATPAMPFCFLKRQHL